jgi:hypothetical protein
MAEETFTVETLGEALALLGSAVTFREESQELAFQAFVEGLAEGEATEAKAEPTKTELLAQAQALGLDVSSGNTKAEIQAAIDAAEEG